MGVLAELTTELKTKLKTVQAEFQPDDLAQAIIDAVRAYSERRPRLAPLTINLVAGQASYNLPEDLIMVEADSWQAATEPLVEEIDMYRGRYDWLEFGSLRSVPALAEPSVTYQIYPGYPPTLVVDPIPTGARTIKAKYLGTHVMNDTSGQTTVPKPDWGLIVRRAIWELYDSLVRERGLRPTFFEAGGDGNTQRVRMADPDKLAELAERSNAEFLRQINKPVGMMG